MVNQSEKTLQDVDQAIDRMKMNNMWESPDNLYLLVSIWQLGMDWVNIVTKTLELKI